MKNIYYTLHKFLKSKLNKYNIEINEREKVIYISEEEIPKNINEYEDYINHVDNLEVEISNILKDFADKYKIFYNNGVVKGTKDRWSCTRIRHMYDYENECVIIIISATNV